MLGSIHVRVLCVRKMMGSVKQGGVRYVGDHAPSSCLSSPHVPPAQIFSSLIAIRMTVYPLPPPPLFLSCRTTIPPEPLGVRALRVARGSN